MAVMAQNKRCRNVQKNRRVADSCHSPEYIASVFRDQVPLRASYTLVVGTKWRIVRMNARGYFLVKDYWGCAAGWGCIFTTKLTIMWLHF